MIYKIDGDNKITKRIFAFDFLKGFAIFYIIILHCIINMVYGSERGDFEVQMNYLGPYKILIMPFIIMAIWGSIFTLLNCASIAYNLTDEAKKSGKIKVRSLKERIITSFLIWVAFLISLFLFRLKNVEDANNITSSLITGYFENGEFNSPTLSVLLLPDTLESIAFSGFFISIILYLLWRKEQSYNAKHAIRILSILAITCVIITIILHNIVGDPVPIARSLFEQKKYVKHYLFIRLYGARFSIFPTFAYGISGAILGISLSEGISYKTIKKYGISISLIFISFFAISIFNGYNFFVGYANEHLSLPLHALTYSGELLTTILLLGYFDFSTKKRQEKRKKRPLVKVLIRYSKITLTIYILEELMSLLWYKFFYYLNGSPFPNNYYIIGLYIIVISLTWWRISIIWERKGFKYSVEYYIGKSKNYLVEIPLTNRKNRKLEKKILTVDSI